MLTRRSSYDRLAQREPNFRAFHLAYDLWKVSNEPLYITPPSAEPLPFSKITPRSTSHRSYVHFLELFHRVADVTTFPKLRAPMDFVIPPSFYLQIANAFKDIVGEMRARSLRVLNEKRISRESSLRNPALVGKEKKKRKLFHSRDRCCAILRI